MAGVGQERERVRDEAADYFGDENHRGDDERADQPLAIACPIASMIVSVIVTMIAMVMMMMMCAHEANGNAQAACNQRRDQRPSR